MSSLLHALAISFGVIFVAELGDKSQLMALTFATRYRAVPILIGISIATALVHAASVAIGFALDTTLPAGWITLAAAIAFFCFAGWTLHGDTLSASEATRARRASGSGVLLAGMTFFLAEIGDKTMLATVTLATQFGPFAAWLGSTAGMVAADAVAIVLGRMLGRQLPERAVRIVAALCFAGFGIVMAFQAAATLSGG